MSAEIDARAYIASDRCLFVCMCNVHAHVYIVVELLPYSEILRVAFIETSEQEHAVTFQGQRDFEVRRDFEEIRYSAEYFCNAKVVAGLGKIFV